jgi:hypothetical protein
MNFESLGQAVNSSSLINILTEKLSATTAPTFRFADHLRSFAERICSEVKFVPLTFPEFTDHSAEIHFPNLFNLSAKLLGETLLSSLYVEELFLLAAGLYAHDWGMAVSADERDLILTGTCESQTIDPLWLLPDEQNRFRKFAADYSIAIDDGGYAPNLPPAYWREYVRWTHADRSATRAYRYFEAIDGGVAQAVSALCKGHWLDIEAIDAEREFPAELNVLNARINLRALALFVRLIDRFDISEDRTPFAIWRFVGPRDPRSQREWKKHRALRPVHTEPYLTARCVVIDGTASDPDVYADLLDLRDCCEKELRETCDLLARYDDERLPFDLAPIIHWNVKAQAFEPIEIRFDFDRGRMFEILGDQIYQGDPCVFLRELLQNAIDAIATRRALQLRRPREGVLSGLIEFDVKHEDDGSCLVECRDNGIGMDEYVVRRYLAVAGKSFYRSEDFKRLGVAVDPISRFGIGILSCFMVADEIEITTHRDPHESPNARPLRLQIPSADRQWRVYRESMSCPIGTSVKVVVKGSKLLDDRGNKMSRLPVTEYLAAIAGFVEFPILIRERNCLRNIPERKAVVLHPDADEDAARAEFGKDIEILQLKHEFAFEDAVFNDDLKLATKHLTTQKIDIKRDLKLPGCEGFVLCCQLADEDCVVSSERDALNRRQGISLVSVAKDKIVADFIGLTEEMRAYVLPQSALTRSASLAKNWSVYLNGILLPAVSPPKRWEYTHQPAPIPLPIVRLNYRSNRLVEASVSRLTLGRDAEPWEKPVWSALRMKVEKIADKMSAKDLLSRSIAASNHAMAFGLTVEEFAKVTTNWPPLCSWINPDGLAEIGPVYLEEVSEIPLTPEIFSYEAFWASELILYRPQSAAGRQTFWRGPRSLTTASSYGETRPSSYVLARSAEFVQSLEITKIQFLSPPKRNLPPLPQRVLAPRKTNRNLTIDQLLNIAIRDPMKLSQSERESILYEGLANDMRYLRSSKVYMGVECWNAFRSAPFAAPFQASFAYGGDYWNAEHPTTLCTIQAGSCIIRALRNDQKNEGLKRLRNLFNLAMNGFIYGEVIASAQAHWDDFWEEFMDAKLCPVFQPPACPMQRDFVPKTFIKDGSSFGLFDSDDYSLFQHSFNRPFGELISEWPP